jgi:hypothetical protein
VEQPLDTIRAWLKPWWPGLWSLHIRASHDAGEHVGRDVLVGALTGIASALIVGVGSENWGLAAIAGIAAPVAVLVGFYLLHLVLNCVRGHKAWEPRIGQADDKLLFELESKVGVQIVNGIACEVRHPSGAVLHAVDERSAPTNGVWFQYPGGDFGEGPPVAEGRYVVIWLEQTRRGRWRQILRYVGTVTR